MDSETERGDHEYWLPVQESGAGLLPINSKNSRTDGRNWRRKAELSKRDPKETDEPIAIPEDTENPFDQQLVGFTFGHSSTLRDCFEYRRYGNKIPA